MDKDRAASTASVVAHRLGEIGELTSSKKWNWISTKLNPADHATRWQKEDLIDTKSWFVGPEFLRLPQAQWPVQKSLTNTEINAIDKMELRKTNVYHVCTVNIDLPLTAKLLDWRGLLAVGRRVRKIIDHWRKSSPIDNESDCEMCAEIFWLRVAQAELFQRNKSS